MRNLFFIAVCLGMTFAATAADYGKNGSNSMDMIQVKCFKDVDVCNQASLEKVFADIVPLDIACCNWQEQFPYVPQVKLRMFHTGSHLVLKYEVTEKCTAAKADGDNGRTWADSCVEFFFQKEGEDRYYNLESTCIGNILMGWRSGRNDGLPATDEQLAAIGRFPSLGRKPFAERLGENSWSIILTVPASAFRYSGIESFSGLKGRFNAYKCGDELSTPHFLSLVPIDTPEPDFHRPEYFTEICFGN